jgi:hypothetical protein
MGVDLDVQVDVGAHVPALQDAAAEVSAVLALHGNVLGAFDLGVERYTVWRG